MGITPNCRPSVFLKTGALVFVGLMQYVVLPAVFYGHFVFFYQKALREERLSLLWLCIGCAVLATFSAANGLNLDRLCGL